MALALQDLVLEVQDIKGAVYRSWKLETLSSYILKGMQFKEIYSKKCKEVKGKGVDLGHQRHFVFLGLLVALKEDEDVDAGQQEVLETLAMGKVRDNQGHVDPTKAHRLAGTMAYCQVVKLAKQGYINILTRGEEGDKIYQILAEARKREGDITYEGPPPMRIHKEIKFAIQGMYKTRDRKRGTDAGLPKSLQGNFGSPPFSRRFPARDRACTQGPTLRRNLLGGQGHALFTRLVQL